MRSVLWIVVLLAGAVLGVFARDEPLCPVKEAIMVHQEDPYYAQRPFVDGGKTFFGGEIHNYGGKVIDVTSPIFDATTNKPTVIGKLAQMTKEDLPPIIDSAKKAWDHGQGTWPQMSPEARISAIQKVVESLKQRRELIVKVLMWEICKSLDDAQVEFDRTMKFIEAAIAEYRSSDAQEGSWRSVSGIYAKVRRLAIGIILCLGPFNYPFNETYATLIPALLMGNVVIMKIPTVGGLAHMLTMEAYAEHLPPGTLNFVSGSGRVLLSPIMKSGAIDVLAFIGGSKAADELIAAHPNPHRLKVFLQLEGKNIGVVMPDANLDTAAQQIVLGATTYNGQRCTAIKTILVHQSVFSSFLEKFLPKVAALKFGLPWQAGGVQITHLPTPGKVRYLTGLVEDAVQHGATIANDQCEVYGETMLRPTVVVGVNPSMRLWHEEQFGPVIPVAVFNQTTELLQYMRETPYGQQASIFTSADVEAGHDVAGDKVQLLDALALAVGRVNINTQCGRSPDVLPFSGRRSSALGTMSVSEALRTFSVELVLAGQDTAANQQVLRNLADASTVLEVTTASPKNPTTAEL